MAVVSVNLIEESYGATETDEGTEYRASFRVMTDDILDGGQVVLSNAAFFSPDFPQRYAQYRLGNDFDPNSYCCTRTPVRDTKARKRWTIACVWKPTSESNDASQPGGGNERITEETIKIGRTNFSIGYTQYQEPIRDAVWIENDDGSSILFGRNHNELGPIVNTANDPFIPAPEKPYAFQVIRMSRTFAAYGDFDPAAIGNGTPVDFCPDLQPYMLSVNNDQFAIIGNDLIYNMAVYNAAIEAWISGGRLGPIPSLGAPIDGGRNFQVNVNQWQQFINDVNVEDVEEQPYTGRVFKKVTVELWIDKRRTFRRQFRSVGLAERRQPGDRDSDEPGGSVSMSTYPNGKVNAQIIDSRGHPVRVPVDLDKDGQDCKKTGLPVTKLKYAVETEKPHAPLIDLFYARGTYFAPPVIPDGILIP